MFASDEFCLTPAYDAGNPEHRRLKRLMEYGASLPDIPPFEGVTDALRQVEFELLEARDMNAAAKKPTAIAPYRPAAAPRPEAMPKPNDSGSATTIDVTPPKRSPRSVSRS